MYSHTSGLNKEETPPTKFWGLESRLTMDRFQTKLLSNQNQIKTNQIYNKNPSKTLEARAPGTSRARGGEDPCVKIKQTE